MIEIINFDYLEKYELYDYLNNISLMLYGCDYNELYFLNNNKFDFSSKNVMFKSG